MTIMFRSLVFVGVVDYRFVLVQFETKLLLIHLHPITKQLFYQLVLKRFGNHKSVKINTNQQQATPPFPSTSSSSSSSSSPSLTTSRSSISTSPASPPSAHAAGVCSLIRLALDSSESGWTPDKGDKDEVASSLSSLLLSRRDMLKDYFSIEFSSSGSLLSLPDLLPGYVPPLMHLPLFLLRLATQCDWTDEEKCFDSVARQLAWFYAVQKETFYLHINNTASPLNDKTTSIPDSMPMTISSSSSSSSSSSLSSSQLTSADSSALSPSMSPPPPPRSPCRVWLDWTIAHSIIPALRTIFHFPASINSHGVVVQLASLEQLYKVFERC